ncbi:lytic transglycosylase domain-containing protein [Bowmanella dokdonensis]|uniref:Lytic transglycosylase domain-containing protein n=2 Tax=Bowmanella dokdonensis TaxID=751969 RepID=A0A939DJI9_9ALTE|nr:lytic transglycosylase domain-containing protein [Bowmanella dokdonensis]MBN7823700.1 lytic transglycosylase domain-containing protein [Bowmanella dokdonensis]
MLSLAQDKLEKQRQQFLEAEKWSYYPNSQTFIELTGQLHDYPLLPYLEQNALLSGIKLSNEEAIARFLQDYDKTPLDSELRQKWLNYLAKRQDQTRFLKYYRDMGDDHLRCLNAAYRLQQSEFREQAFKLVPELWLVGKSQDKACDPVFRQWTEAGHRTNEMIWQRLALAADGGDHTLVPYLQSLLPKSQQYLGDLWLQARRNPASVSRLTNFPVKQPEREKQILIYALKRLVWRDQALAVKTWQKAADKFQFRFDEELDMARGFAIAMAVENHPQAEFWLEKANQGDGNEDIFRWHLTHVLRHKDWQHVADVIGNAPKDLESDYSSRYWLARSYEHLNDPVAAQKQFDTLSSVRHYYGFMASGKLARTPSLADSPLQVSETELQAIADLPAARRAQEFLALKRYTSARREWLQMQPHLTHSQGLAAAVLADNWGWHDQAIFAFSRLGYLDDVKRRFPLAFDAQLLQSASKHHVDPAWAFAIARRESSFMVDANSGAGAKGLMQLMPGTARYLAKKQVSNQVLFDPQQNVEFGTQYLRYLMDKMQDNPVLATAAYNAGWRRVQQWLPKEGVPLDIWVETIPYKETRNYVKAVMAYKQIYKQRLGQEQNLFKDLANMQISSAMTAM